MRLSEKEKSLITINQFESNAKKPKYSLKHNRTMSNNHKSFISNNENAITKRQFPYLNRNKFNYNYNYDINQEIINSMTQRRNIFNSNLYEIKEKQKEKLIMEIHQSNNELKNQEKEIRKFQNLYGTIREDNLANQYILCQILNKDNNKNNYNNKENNKSNYIMENNKQETEKEISLNVDNANQKSELVTVSNNYNKNDKKSISFKEDKYSNSNIDANSFFITGTNNLIEKNYQTNYTDNKRSISLNMKKNKTFITNNKNKIKFKKKKETSKLQLLKKELAYYLKSIDEDTKKLSKFKENEKISGFIRTREELDKKNKELDELITKSNGLQGDINDNDMLIYFYQLKNDNYNSLINDIKRKINSKHKPIYANWEKRIQKLQSQKELLENQNKLYKSEIDKMKEINEKNKKKEKELAEYLKKNEKYLEEKSKNNIEIANSYNNEQRLKQKIDMKNRKIERTKESNKNLNELIIKTETEKKNTLIKKAKTEKIQKEKMNKIMEEINNINKDMQKYSFTSIVEQKCLANENNKNNDILNEQKKEIEYLMIKEKKIINDINDLNKELEIISKESENQKNEMQLLIKTFEEINANNNNNSNSINPSVLKEENENLLKIYNQKNTELNEAIQKNNKLNNILKGIKQI